MEHLLSVDLVFSNVQTFFFTVLQITHAWKIENVCVDFLKMSHDWNHADSFVLWRPHHCYKSRKKVVVLEEDVFGFNKPFEI